MASASSTLPASRAFGALGLPGYRAYLGTFMLTMMADNVEHVISYWVCFQKFHSPALGGFAVVSHWLPYLVFSVTSSQMLLYDIVGAAALPSAVRLAATARYLGVLVGPGVGSIVMLTLGPTRGIFLNTVFYLPLFLWLVRAPYGRHFRKDRPPPRRAVRGLADIVQTIGEVRLIPPDATRGRVLGLYNMAAAGLRAFSGVTVGLLGSIARVHASLAVAAASFVSVAMLLFTRMRRA